MTTETSAYKYNVVLQSAKARLILETFPTEDGAKAGHKSWRMALDTLGYSRLSGVLAVERMRDHIHDC